MGKWTVQHTEDVLLAKIRTAIQDAIETHRNEKRQDGEARPVTLTEFVEELDAKDAFTAKLMEILVKEYSERRSRVTPVERQFQIATRTSNALSSMLSGASVYDNCRPSHWPRRRRVPVSFRAHMNDEGNPFGVEDPNTSSLRDELFQNALEELEDGEFGAHWNSTLNEVYADGDTYSRWRRTRDALQPIPILHDVNMGSLGPDIQQDGSGMVDSVSVSSSSIGSDIETHVAQNAETISRLQARIGSSTNSLINRQSLSRAPLLRRNSLRRSRYGRPPTSIDMEAARRRIYRSMAEEHDAQWTPPDEGSIGSEWTRYFGQPATTTRTSNLIRGDETAGTGFRRRWSTLDPDPVASGSNDAVPRSGPRSLRRGGLRAPEALSSRSRLALASPSIMTTPSSPIPPGASTTLNEEIHPWDQLRPVGSIPLPSRWGPDSVPLYPNWGLPESSAPVLPPLATTSSGVIPTPPAEPETAAEE